MGNLRGMKVMAAALYHLYKSDPEVPGTEVTDDKSAQEVNMNNTKVDENLKESESGAQNNTVKGLPDDTDQERDVSLAAIKQVDEEDIKSESDQGDIEVSPFL